MAVMNTAAGRLGRCTNEVRNACVYHLEATYTYCSSPGNNNSILYRQLSFLLFVPESYQNSIVYFSENHLAALSILPPQTSLK